ncbi:MAG: NADH-quinone oxidoreductase subunit D [Deltaproteobacteria bacterium]|nr:NADH-quinone oxidoreductase subunit D [Deltaproteobacteria bacterium]
MTDIAPEFNTHPMELNIGPSHPAMHGTIRIKVELDGETIIKSNTEVGFLHRAFEKECESVRWAQCLPYTDRLNYVSPLINNFGFTAAVEKLLNIEIPIRAQYIRVIASELSRISDHLTCLAAMSMELGGFTAYLYFIEGREYIYDLIEELTGARVTVNYARIGGVALDLPVDFDKHIQVAFKKVFKLIDDSDKLLTHNRIFIDRTAGVGQISSADAIAFGITGPFLRATGFAHDLRKVHPYYVYNNFEFDIPIGSQGDVYDRFLVRLEELRQSRKIINQALTQIPNGDYILNEHYCVLPTKDRVYTTIEGLMHHFKVIIDGAQVPAGEVYSYSEGANGELGFYLVSDGSGYPYKCRLRSPCFVIMAALDEVLLKNANLADVVPIFGSINMIGGECDR